MFKKFIISIIFMITGCVSSKQEDVSGLIRQRYETISSQLPVQNGRYTLIKVAPVSCNTLQFLVINSRNSASSVAESQHFLSDFAGALCEERQSKEVLLAGGKYQILLQEEGRSPVSLFVDKSVCHYG